jgi:hypothetical protein
MNKLKYKGIYRSRLESETGISKTEIREHWCSKMTNIYLYFYPYIWKNDVLGLRALEYYPSWNLDPLEFYRFISLLLVIISD